MLLRNGDRLINFAFNNHLMVSNTKFQHLEHHLVTWYSNDGVTANQIDYILDESAGRAMCLTAAHTKVLKPEIHMARTMCLLEPNPQSGLRLTSTLPDKSVSTSTS